MRSIVLSLTLLASSALAADFEGVITGKPTSTTPGKTHLETMKMYLSPAGVRMEATGEASLKGKSDAGKGDSDAFQMTVLWRAAEPGVTYIINDQAQAYMKHDISKDKETSTAEAPKVEKLGKTTFLGRSVERIKVTFPSPSNREQELWIDTSIKFPAAALAAFSQEQRSGSSSLRSLEKAGVTGIPLKEINAAGGSGWEATSVEKKSLPASLFQVPASFHQAKDPLEMAPPGKQAELKKQRDAQLKAMTPEQRAKLEEMMKKYQQ
jgi:hypothetical protein